MRKRKSALGTGKGFSTIVFLVFVVRYVIVVLHGQSRKYAMTNEASFTRSFTRFGSISEVVAVAYGAPSAIFLDAAIACRHD